ncbi:hypothetical protein EDB80DRAFT_839820, partial [Ilyonectria destructans]
FLEFIHLIFATKIPIFSPTVTNARQTLAGTGTLGRGGQYLVDRIYDNQRWSDKLQAGSESSVVYKRLADQGAVDYATVRSRERDMLESLVREVRLLCQLRDHKNITKLLGVAWEQVDAGNEVRPMLVIELAQLGSLHTLLRPESTKTLPFSQKRELCFDIAQGMSAIHSYGFVWGDAKPDNVLVFEDERRLGGMTAKLSDFGICETQFTPQTQFRGFTLPWVAPEVSPDTRLHPRPKPAIGFEEMVMAEVYAFGMIAWMVAMDGCQFERSLWVDNSSTSTQEDDGRQLSERVSREEITIRQNDPISPEAMTKIAQDSVWNYLRKESKPLASHADSCLMLSILKQSLHYERKKRSANMSWFVACLAQGHQLSTYSSVHIPDFAGEFDQDYLSSTYGSCTYLSPVADAIFDKLQRYAVLNNSAAGFFQLAIFHFVGFYVPRDLAMAAELMRKSASMGFEKAFALLQRVETAKSLSDIDSEGGLTLDEDLIDLSSANSSDVEWLVTAALGGSWMAAEDLRDTDENLLSHVVGLCHSARVGYNIHEAENGSRMHRAALSGQAPALLCYLEEEESAINTRNSLGETLLICAMRAGQADIVQLLLERGADVEVHDKRGVTALHWIITLDKTEITKIEAFLQGVMCDVRSHESVQHSQHFGATLEAGTPLDWAVDTRNEAAAQFFLGLGANPLLQTKGRTSALHRASGRHDVTMSRILTTSATSNVADAKGNMPLAYCFDPGFEVERHLINASCPMSLTRQIQLLLSLQADPGYVNSAGEDVIYCAVRSGDKSMLQQLLEWEKEPQLQSLISVLTRIGGPNSWSSLRRAVYVEDVEVFRRLWTCLKPEDRVGALSERSPDGLHLMHELCFCSSQRAGAGSASIAKIILDDMEVAGEDWFPRDIRLSKWRDRPQFTAFQLAVLCQRLDLADLLVKHGASPLAGLEKMRFLGFLIEYQKYKAVDLSTWVSRVELDRVPNALRRFPHPTTIEPSIAYLLGNDSKWWDKATDSWLRRVGLPTLLRYIIYSGPDQDADHDPMMSRRPGLVMSMRSALDVLPNPNEDHAVELFGTSGAADANALAFQHRARHVADFGSFLVAYRRDTMMNAAYGHEFVTAVESAFDMLMTSPYPEATEKVFHLVADHFSGKAHLNFPYYYYLPHGRTCLRNLVRRETVLHRAIRAQKPSIVRLLLENDADWEMANISWQSPLRLATLIHEGREPDRHTNHGSFMQRVSPVHPPSRVAVNARNCSDDKAGEVLHLLEDHAGSRPRAWHSELWPSGLGRALGEVHWPWSEYETDDLGIRFLIFYALLLGIPLALFWYPLNFWSQVTPGWIDSVWLLVGHSWFDTFLGGLRSFELADCYMAALENGTNPRQICTANTFASLQEIRQSLFPAYLEMVNVTNSLFNVWDDCYNGSYP